MKRTARVSGGARRAWLVGSIDAALFGAITVVLMFACGVERAVTVGKEADDAHLPGAGADAHTFADATAADAGWDSGFDAGVDAAETDAAVDSGTDVGSDAGFSDGGGRPQVTIDNYPEVDGSTSTLPLARVIACELLGLSFNWVAGIGDEGAAEIVAVPKTSGQEELATAVNQKIVHNKTHKAYLNVVDSVADLILVANPPSEDELVYAEAAGVTLVWEPVALDALVMLLNSSNTVSDLTRDEIRGIFMAEIINWNVVGGTASQIHPYVRPINSGSQQLFNAIVMEGLSMPEWPPDRIQTSMGGLVDAITNDGLSIGYSVYYYVTYQRPLNGAKTIAVNGIAPSSATIGEGAYPFAAPVLVVIRSNLDTGTLAFQMRQWLLTPDGQKVVAKSGYVPVLH